MAANYQRQKKRLEREEQRRLCDIINDKVGKGRKFAGTVQASDPAKRDLFADKDLLADIWPQMSNGSAIALWADGSCKRDRGNYDTLGAGVVMKEERADEWGWRDMSFPLGKETGSSEDAELFAIAAAAAFAAKEVQEGNPVRLVRIFSDCLGVLEGIENGKLMFLGPAFSSPWAIQTLYDSTDFLLKKGVKVELAWVKGHGQSEGNNRADGIAKGAVRVAEAEMKPQGWVKRDTAPQGMKDLGEDSVEEWYWRMNKERMLRGEEEAEVDDAASQGSADMDVSDEDLSDS